MSKKRKAKKPEPKEMTRREYFAVKALQGLIALEGSHEFNDASGMAILSVRLADALIKELDK